MLFATASFWEGVDVPGDALLAVVIDRLPVRAAGGSGGRGRLRALEGEGRDGFSEPRSWPPRSRCARASAGSSARARTAALVAILDRRLVTKGYGARSSPRCRTIRVSDRGRGARLVERSSAHRA